MKSDKSANCLVFTTTSTSNSSDSIKLNGDVGTADQRYESGPSIVQHWCNSSYVPNSTRSQKFRNLWRAIDTMSRMPEGDELHLSQATAKIAVKFLAALHDNWNVDAPLLLPDDSQYVSLTWDAGIVKRFVSLAPEEYDALDLNRISRVRCKFEVPSADPAALDKLIEHLEFSPKASTADSSFNA